MRARSGLTRNYDPAMASADASLIPARRASNAGLTLYLASRSPRRRLLLSERGFAHEVIDAGVDDGQLSMGSVSPDQWVLSLSYLKARGGWERLDPSLHPTAAVLGADTVVVKGDRVIGQPRDAADARRIIGLLENGEHRVVTGVTILTPPEAGAVAGDLVPTEHMLVDAADVRVGAIGPQSVHKYIESGDWRGKAGAYNLSERLEAGWPISFVGDPGTIMGLPMRRLEPLLNEVLGCSRP